MNEDEKLAEENDLEDYDTVEVEQKDKQETTGSVVEDYPNLSIKIEQAQYSIFEFLDDIFKLKNLKILSQINGMSMKEMDADPVYSRYATTIEDTQLVVQIIKYPTKDRVRFDIFDRVNRGGTPLNKQEMRNALYQGAATKLLKDLSEMDSFQKATGSAVSGKHMTVRKQDEEQTENILRTQKRK